MLFNSVTFLLFFLPVSLLVYYLLGRLHMYAAKFWLAALSFIFYGWWNPHFLWLLAFSIFLNYGCGYLIQICQEKPRTTTALLTLGIGINLSILFYYKYLLTLLDWSHEHGFYQGLSWGSAILPLGLSFFTFTQIGFLIDVKTGNAQERGFLEYILFVTFFPHLIAGPILHHREMMPQFAKKETYALDWSNISVGLSLFIIGLAKKVLIADQLAPLANDIFQSPADKHVLEAWCGVMAYTFQLYFDFSAYSEMALGLARMFNVKFPANFDSPIRSKSISDFWQRWHISLTRYLTLYLYNPVSLWIIRRRAAKGMALLKAEETTVEGYFSMLVVPTLYTMILIGIWHGAGFQFFIFGLLHGIYICINHAWRIFGPKAPKKEVTPVKAWFDGLWKWALTYVSFVVSFVFFRAKNFDEAMQLVKSLVGGGTGDSPGGAQGVVESILDFFGVSIPYWNYANCFLTLAVAFFITLTLPNLLQLFEKQGASLTRVKAAKPLLSFEWQGNFIWAFLLATLFVIDLLMVTGTTEFLYFRF